MVSREMCTEMAVNSFVSSGSFITYLGHNEPNPPQGGQLEGSGWRSGQSGPGPSVLLPFLHLLRVLRTKVAKATSCSGRNTTRLPVYDDEPIIYNLYSVKTNMDFTSNIIKNHLEIVYYTLIEI